MANEFLVSVADVVARDQSTGNVLFLGKANINSAFTTAMQATDVRGGINNPLLFTYYTNREVTVSIEAATFDKSLIALNAGTTVVNGTYTVVKTEGITLSGGSAILSETPIGNVGVILPDKTIQTVTPSGATIVVSGGANKAVTAIYNYSETLVDQVVGYAVNPPTGVELIMTSEVRNASNVKVYDFQVIVPNFNISGNSNLALTANGVSTQKIEGKALVYADANGDYYYKASWIPSTATTVAYTDIAATPSVLTFSAASLPKTGQITVLGIRGGVYANVNVTTSCSFVRTSGCAGYSVGAGTGLVTASSAIKVGDTALITATYYDTSSGSISDTMSLACAA